MKKLLWIIEKQFDIALDKATYLEIFYNFKPWYDFYLLTGFLYKQIEPSTVFGKIKYYDSIKIPFINRLTSFFSQSHSFSQIFTKFAPDLIVVTVSNPFLLQKAALFKRKYGVKLIFDVRTLPVSNNTIYRSISEKFFKYNLKYASKHFDGITYITEEMYRYCTSYYNLFPHSKAFWSSGVNPDLFKPQKINYELKPLKFMYHGAINRKRGVGNLVKAISFLKDIDVNLNFLGDGDAVNELNNMVDSLGIRDKVFFHKPIDYQAVPNWINHGHIGVLPFPNWPGWNVSSPIKLFEYLSCGKPVIATDIPAHIDVLKNQDFVYWSEGSTPEAISRAMRKAYNNRLQLDILSEEARNHVLENYTWECQSKHLKQFIDKLLI